MCVLHSVHSFLSHSLLSAPRFDDLRNAAGLGSLPKSKNLIIIIPGATGPRPRVLCTMTNRKKQTKARMVFRRMYYTGECKESKPNCYVGFKSSSDASAKF